MVKLRKYKRTQIVISLRFKNCTLILKNKTSKNILVAPLNWGLGHATRCIPIIKELLLHGFQPILASDGIALSLLQKEFPELKTLELPSYHIEYAKNGSNFKWKLLKNSPAMIKAILEEKKIVKKWVKKYDLQGIISDNRLGVFSKKVPSVFITHQFNVMTGNTTWITSKMHQFIIKKYAECWVPDVAETPNLSGKLGHLKEGHEVIKYIGPISRFEKKDLPKKFDLMVLLSGPEPQRTLLENILKLQLQSYKGKLLFVRGKVESDQKMEEKGNITCYNYMTSEQLETAINESELILSRSGYTTIMDLAKLGKKAFFIPTPGQYEQLYLSKKLIREGVVPSCKQDTFRIEMLEKVKDYKGLQMIESNVNWKQLFCLFERE